LRHVTGRPRHRPAEVGAEDARRLKRGKKFPPAKQQHLFDYIVLAFGIRAVYDSAICSGGFFMCDNNVGVARRLDLESISQDIAKLVKELDKEVEGKVQVSDLKKIEAKVHKIIAA
jgi:hypothetical protein